MTEPRDVLDLMKVAYGVYLVLICSLVAFYAFRLVRPGRITRRLTGMFCGWVALLACIGIGFHVATYLFVPWKELDLHRDQAAVDQEFNVTMSNYEFHLPEHQLTIREGEVVRFSVKSSDLTYGFGLFGEDNSMLFQMQVSPGAENDLVWHFVSPGTYSIRSTEYSGPKGANLVAKDAVVVTPT